jgi:molecular chaperone DnaK (HSP70)
MCPKLYQEYDFINNISEAVFEIFSDELFRSCMNPVQQVIRDGEVSKEKINDIVLVESLLEF